MRWTTVSLRSEIIFNLVFILIVALVFMGILMLSVVQNMAIQERLGRADLLVSYYQNQISQSFLAGNPSAAENWSTQTQKFISLLNRDQNELEIIVVDRLGRYVAGTHPELGAIVVKDANLKEALSFQRETYEVKGVWLGIWFTPNARIEAAAPIFLTERRLVGALKMVFSLRDLRGYFLKFYKILAIFIVLDTLIIMAFGLVMFSRSLLKPVEKLVQATRQVAQGDFAVSVITDRNDELGNLSRSFLSMTTDLARGKEELEARLRELEEVNCKLKQAQDEVIRSEKLASVGRLAAGVAHEIGNPLGAILGFTDLLLKGTLNPKAREEALKRIQTEITRIDQIIRELLDYSRQRPENIQIVELHEILNDTMKLISGEPEKRKVEIVRNFAVQPMKVRADAQRLRQVFLNLTLNALDAMPSGGRLTVTTESIISEDASGPWTRITFADTGMGIASEHLALIFDPFFTTKDVGKGTGLGLAIALRIIESCGGSLKVESVLQQGSVFTILLPEEA